jgi:hypothetical protein
MFEPIPVTHRTVSGLGHRLQWMSTVHHLVKAMNLSNGLVNMWGWECDGGTKDGSSLDIFYYLFGDYAVLSVTPLRPDDLIYSSVLIEIIKKIKDESSLAKNLPLKELRFSIIEGRRKLANWKENKLLNRKSKVTLRCIHVCALSIDTTM